MGKLAPKFASYALGWGLQDYQGRKLVGHTGGVAGFVSRVMLVPEENLGIVILTNAEEGYAFESIMYHVLDSYFGRKNRLGECSAPICRKREKDAAEEMNKQSGKRRLDSKHR